MLASTQNITSLDWPKMGIIQPNKQKLTIDYGASEVFIYINNSYKPPISWFLTNNEGEMILLGQIADSSSTLDFRSLPCGLYFLRIAGEIHQICNY